MNVTNAIISFTAITMRIHFVAMTDQKLYILSTLACFRNVFKLLINLLIVPT